MAPKSLSQRKPCSSPPRSQLIETVSELARLYDRSISRGPTAPFEMILWENIGYLVDDERRAKLFEEFETRVGVSASAISAAPNKLLLGIAQQGGMRPQERVAKWRHIAGITIDRAGGNLNAAVKRMPLSKAVALLKAYPSIGETGVDRIMLLSGLDIRPALDSNGLRTMLRLGFVKEANSYSASYRAAKAELISQGKPTGEWFTSAFHVLKAHGRALCKRSVPLCVACALSETCPQRKLKGLY